MKKDLLYIFVALVVILMIGYVFKQDYDAVVKERDDLKTQVSSLQADSDKYKTLKSDVTAIQTRLAKEMKALTIYRNYQEVINNGMSMSSYYSAYLTAIALTMKTKVSDTQRWDVNFNVPSLIASTNKFIGDFSYAIAEVGNPELSQLWNEFTQLSKDMDFRTASNKISSLGDLLINLVNDDTNALEAALR